MALGRIIIPKHLHGTDDLHTGVVCRNDDDALLAVLVRVVRVALSKDEVQGATRVTSPADVPTMAVSEE